MNVHKIALLKAQNVDTGVQVFVATTDAHLALTALLVKFSIPNFYVRRGVPSQIDSDTIKGSLVTANLPVIAVHCMFGARNRKPYDMVLAILEKTDAGRQIYYLDRVLDLCVRVEAPNSPPAPVPPVPTVRTRPA